MSLIHDSQALVRRLQRFLPLRAHARPNLLGELKRRYSDVTSSSTFVVTNIYDAGGADGLMCKIEFRAGAPIPPVLVVPIAHLAFDRRHPISRDVADYIRRRTNRRREGNGQ
jgi:hypothetical protein